MPDCLGLVWYRTIPGIVSFSVWYRTDRMPDNPAFIHTNTHTKMHMNTHINTNTNTHSHRHTDL